MPGRGEIPEAIYFLKLFFGMFSFSAEKFLLVSICCLSAQHISPGPLLLVALSLTEILVDRPARVASSHNKSLASHSIGHRGWLKDDHMNQLAFPLVFLWTLLALQ